VSLHETSAKAAALDEVAPVFDVKTFQHGREQMEELQKTRRGFEAKSKTRQLTDNVGVDMFSRGTAKGSAMNRLKDVWSMMSMEPPNTANRASGWIDSTVRHKDKPSALSQLHIQPKISQNDDDDAEVMKQL
jgi:hypothetical protein